MRIVIPGGTGFLGGVLASRLAGQGHRVIVLSRRAPASPPSDAWREGPALRAMHWRGDASTTGWGHVVNEADAVINLAGESIAARRWTARQKSRLVQSRLETTRAVVEAIGSSATPPPLLINASAIGYYGSRGNEVLTEISTPGHDFLAQLTVAWEAEAMRGASGHTRVVLLRSGVVLAEQGGAFEQMARPFRFGVGGRMGSGEQYLPWIHRDDWLGLVVWLTGAGLDGPVNLVAPAPVTNAVFTKALGTAMHRPTVMTAPAVALRLALGEMADGLLLASQRALPERAREHGFEFRYASIDDAIARIVGQRRRG